MAEGFACGYARRQDDMLDLGIPAGLHGYCGFRVGYAGRRFTLTYELAKGRDQRIDRLAAERERFDNVGVVSIAYRFNSGGR